ncbi:Sulfate transporter 2.1 [Linum grandiflorum]
MADHIEEASTVDLSCGGRSEQDSKSNSSGHRWVLNAPDPPGMCRVAVDSVKRTFGSFKKEVHGCGFEHFGLVLQSMFPVLSWGRNYKLKMFKNDLMAGLTLASLCIPQSIGYATLANLEPQYGLYTSVIPPLIYAVMGTSREMAIGPVAVVSLLLSSMLQKLQDPSVNPDGFRNLVFTATLFAGVFQAAFGLFRLGFLVDFLSHAAIVGFMAGAAIVIGLQQLKGLLGISHFTNKTDVVSVGEAVWTSVHHSWNPYNFVLGISFLCFIMVSRFVGRRYKKLFWLGSVAPLISVALSTLVVYLTGADRHGVNIIKHIKGGSNPSSVHHLQLNDPHIGEVAKTGLVVAVIALTEAVAVGRSFATMKGYNIDGNKEMVAIGFMNVVGSFTSCYVATGSFSRSAVNFSAGCETAVSNVVMAVTVFLCLELFTRLLYYTPMAILASIILSALPGLIDFDEALKIWRIDKLDFLACFGAFVGVLFASVEIGLLIAVGISFFKIILISIQPGTETLGRMPGTQEFCDIEQYPVAIQTPQVLTIRIKSGLLCFANANFIKERIMRLATQEDEKTGKPNGGRSTIQLVVLDLSSKYLTTVILSDVT